MKTRLIKESDWGTRDATVTPQLGQKYKYIQRKITNVFTNFTERWISRSGPTILAEEITFQYQNHNILKKIQIKHIK